jgi:monovalent cation:H+ antiporter-2, CPA2 family
MNHSEGFAAFLIVIVAITIIPTILYKLKIPTIAGFIIAGLIIGPSGLNWVHSIPVVSIITELGIMLLLFSLGLEISFADIRRLAKLLLGLGLSQVVLTTGLSLVIFVFLFDIHWQKAFLFGAFLALSSTAAVIKLMQEHREVETPFGRAAISTLLLQDMATLPLMALIPIMATGSTIEGTTLSLRALQILGFAAACVIFSKYLLQRLFDQVVRTNSRELFFFLALSLVLGTAYFSERVGLSFSLGAFISGLLLAESPYSKQVLAELSPLRDNFLGLFFVSIGLLLDLSFVGQNFSKIIVLIGLMFSLKFFILYGIARVNRFSHGVSLATALSLAQIGEFSFILAAASKDYGMIDDSEFQYFLTLAVLSVTFTPLLFWFSQKASAHADWRATFRSRRTQRLSEKVQHPEKQKAIVIGLGHSGENILATLTHLKIPAHGIDFNMTLVRKMNDLGLSASYGNATRPEVLHAAGIDQAFLVIIAVTGRQLTSHILAVVHALRPDVKTLVRSQFIQELDILPIQTHDQVVLAEVEVTRKLLIKAMESYGVESQQLQTRVHDYEQRAHHLSSL